MDVAESSSEVLNAKIITMVCLFSISMVFGCLPFLISLKWDWFTKSSGPNMRSSNQLVLGLLAFGGGVLFATTFMHLLPEVDENIQLLIDEEYCTGSSEAGSSSAEPLPEVELEAQPEPSPKEATMRGPAATSSSGAGAVGGRPVRSTRGIAPVKFDDYELEEGKLPELHIYLAALIMCSGFFMMYLVEELVHVYINSRENKTANTSFTRVLSIRRVSKESGSGEKLDKTADLKEVDVAPAGHSHNHSHLPLSSEDDTVVAALRGLLIVLALSIHELFEGLAVGLESSAGNVWYMFGAVSAHKYIIAFCIGVELLAAGTKRWLSIAYIFTFSFVSALGIGVGVLLVGGAGAADAGLYSVVLQGLACGTLVYVVFFEIWRQDRSGMLQFVCAVLGFSLMVGLEVLVEMGASNSG